MHTAGVLQNTTSPVKAYNSTAGPTFGTTAISLVAGGPVLLGILGVK